jgi:hypothetical protein
METKKIIGYKYPHKTINGEVTKNKTLTLHNDYYIIENFEGFKYFLPKEIAESFEPIYEEVVFGSFEDIITHFKGNMVRIATHILIFFTDYSTPTIRITKQNYKFTPEFEEKLKELGIEI